MTSVMIIGTAAVRVTKGTPTCITLMGRNLHRTKHFDKLYPEVLAHQAVDEKVSGGVGDERQPCYGPHPVPGCLVLRAKVEQHLVHHAWDVEHQEDQDNPEQDLCCVCSLCIAAFPQLSCYLSCLVYCSNDGYIEKDQCNKRYDCDKDQ